MAIQQTRSAFVLTTDAMLSLSKVFVLLTLARGIVASDLSVGNTDHISILKFGDRIAPRSRPFHDAADKPKTVSVNEQQHQQPINSGSSVISSLNSNNNYNQNDSVKRNLTALPFSDISGADDDEFDDDDSVADGLFDFDVNDNEQEAQTNDSSATNRLRRTKSSGSRHTDDGIATGRAGLPLIGGHGDVPFIRNDEPLLSSNVSSAQAHRLEMSTEFFVVPPPTSATNPAKGHNMRAGGIILPNAPTMAKTKKTSTLEEIQLAAGGNTTQPTIVSTHNPLGLRKEPWVVPVLVLSSLAMIAMAAFEVFVLCKAWQTSPSRRHLFLGQMLLLGLFCCAGLAAILTTTPTVLSCGILRFCIGVSYALVFASLLVKCVFLISLNSGVYLPAPYQGLLLLFAVLIQVAVGAQWLLNSPADIENVPVPIRRQHMGLTRYPLLLTAQDISVTITLCKTAFHELLFSLVYCVFLILFVAILAIKSRRIRENYREATYIGLAIGGSIPIWLGWTLCGLAVTERHKDACLAFGLVATSATVFLVMFMPKGRQLAAMGKEGLYMEDRDEQFNSLSRAGSGYSPSFFHFKPIKYGVMGNTLASNNNTTSRTTSKNPAVAALGNGKSISHTFVFMSGYVLFLCILHRSINYIMNFQFRTLSIRSMCCCCLLRARCYVFIAMLYC